MIWGIILLIFGGIVWILNLVGNGFQWGRDWPIFVILFAIYEITKGVNLKNRKKSKNLKKILKDVESGKLKAEEAKKYMEEDDE
ncbi:hypothetical protein J7L85_03045 [candidate division WOR-3 bacterium]|nr:hypothetical protein [candidate division WOR-3 bacterium]